LKLEDGEVTYKIKDSQGTIASGSLGEVANPFRQVQYLVLRASRSGSYGLIDLRLDALGLYAGHQTQVEDFEVGDGSFESVSTQAQEVGSPLLEAAMDFLEAFWTGWWPVLHIVVTSSPLELCSLSLHVTVDLLGSFEIAAVNSSYYGLQTMNEEDQETAEQDTIEVVQSIWDDPLNWLTLGVGVSFLTLTIATILMQVAGLFTAWAIALGLFAGCCVALVIYTYMRFLQFGLTGEQAGFRFLLLVLSLLGVVAGSLGTLYLIGCRTLTRILDYWRKLDYWNRWAKTGNKGRAAGGNLICSLLILGLVIICSLDIASKG
jgi:hypothetical protein